MTKDEIAALPPYERRAAKLYNYLWDDMYSNFLETSGIDIEELPEETVQQIKKACAPNVINYYLRKSPNTPEITGKVFEPPVVNFNKQVELKWAFDRVKELLTTKSGAVRKKYVDMPEYEVYDWGCLLEYLRQQWRDGESYAYISCKEFKMLEED